MKKILVLALALIMPALAVAQDAVVAAAAPQVEMTDEAKAAEEKGKTLYAVGYLMGKNIKTQLLIEDADEYKYISQGMRDSLLDKPSQIDVKEYNPKIIEYYKHSANILNDRRIKEQKDYLANVKEKRGTKILRDQGGIVVQTLSDGKGKKPMPTSVVKVHYTGTFLDGSVFDSSVERGEPAVFPLNGVIRCWTHGLANVKQGSKVRLTCPSDTAYGPTGFQSIPPNKMLFFDIELIEIDPVK
ncbi:FKBP-type peptidyl-prolyl cis-trans isomerase FkpA/FKBP-type peptidyl-prolyl cis-trans isomerase FklB [Parelusimicrobium proximum]|uniref:FKBP-type peptidyl-prolyl cis-trans isomerase n=1 Tax=Parelusimicrobium proximum TaxID=3228953 RepID=UPI003D16C8F9